MIRHVRYTIYSKAEMCYVYPSGATTIKFYARFWDAPLCYEKETVEEAMKLIPDMYKPVIKKIEWTVEDA